jgi:hypothetical protein
MEQEADIFWATRQPSCGLAVITFWRAIPGHVPVMSGLFAKAASSARFCQIMTGNPTFECAPLPQPRLYPAIMTTIIAPDLDRSGPLDDEAMAVLDRGAA